MHKVSPYTSSSSFVDAILLLLLHATCNRSKAEQIKSPNSTLELWGAEEQSRETNRRRPPRQSWPAILLLLARIVVSWLHDLVISRGITSEEGICTERFKLGNYKS